MNFGVEELMTTGLDRLARTYLADERLTSVDFSQPTGEPALAAPDSISWRIFKNPVSLFIGGVAAVILEFAEPRVRTGVWEHSTFRADPVLRLKRTGLAAMVTVYGAKSVAEKMIAQVTRMHNRVAGVTPSGEPYAASDPELLDWVQATATYGFLESYHAYVAPLSDEERNAAYMEGRPAACLYGAAGAPLSIAEQRALFDEMTPRFERSDIVFEFLSIMRTVRALPRPMNMAQGMFVRAAIEIVPPPVRRVLGLGDRFGLRSFERSIVERLGAQADRIILPSSPPVQACRRLGLNEKYLYTDEISRQSS